MKTNEKGKTVNTVVAESVTPAYLRQAADELEALEQEFDAKRQNITAVLAGKGIAVPGAPKATVRNGTRTVKTSSGQVRHFSPASIAKIKAGQQRRKVKRVQGELAAKLNRAATAEEIAAESGLTVKQVEVILKSLTAPVANGAPATPAPATAQPAAAAPATAPAAAPATKPAQTPATASK